MERQRSPIALLRRNFSSGMQLIGNKRHEEILTGSEDEEPNEFRFIIEDASGEGRICSSRKATGYIKLSAIAGSFAQLHGMSPL